MEKFDEEVANNPLFAKGVSLCREIERIGGEGAEALIVGGSVRDLLLNKPISDVDIATNVDIDEIQNHFKTDDIGKSKDFGIVNVHYMGEQFEVANYRTESDYTDGRRPDKVQKAETFFDDSSRRDFSINSMGVNADGEIVDYHNGLDALKRGLIAAVGDPKQRFIEDSLRIMRALRFAVKFGFEIEPETKKAMIELGHLTDNLSKERVAEEIYKVAGLSGKALADYLERLDEVGLLERILPELYTLKNMKHNLKHHPEGGGLVLGHVLEALRHSRSRDAVTNLAIAFHDLGKATTYDEAEGKHTYHGHEQAGVPIVQEIGKRLKLSSKDIDIIAFCAANHMRIHKIYEMSKSKVVAMVNHPYWPYLKEVGYADEMCRGFSHSTVEEFEKKIEYAEQLAANANKGGGSSELRSRIKNLVDGNKLMAWIPDLKKPELRPFMGKILNKLAEDIVDENLFDSTEDEIRNRAINYFEQMT